MKIVSILVVAVLLSGCSMFGPKRDPIPLVPAVDLPRFMGTWYEIGFTPTFLVRDAHNGVEYYELNDDGTIATTYQYRDGAFDGKLKTNTPKGFVEPGTGNALWGMQFVWPFKGEYRIVHLEPDYSVTIIARNKRDYVWLMAREPEMSDADFTRYRQMIGDMGYDLADFKRHPQQWPEASPRPPLKD
tara:strand:- start:37 stop:597 length:561 start_codon:yes stop_codon:yes gene_type:complete